MSKSSNNQSSGHIKHLDVDMDPHDRAVRRNSGQPRSKADASGSTVWLICLLLFVGLVGFFLIRIPARYRNPDVTSVEIVTEAEPISTEPVMPEPVLDPIPATEENTPLEGTLLISEDVSEDSVQAEEAVIESVPQEPAVPGAHVHSFVNGVCSICGAKPQFLTDWLPDEFYQEAEHQGTLTAVEYDTKAFASYNVQTYHKRMNVYLPWGYDETKPYNVLILIHGQGDNEDAWLSDVHISGTRQMSGRVILDNIFEQGLAEPCIVVTPVTETKLVQGLTSGIIQMQNELRETILPYIVEHYSTYAADSSLESIQAARSHFGLGGLSNGALFTYEGGMRHDFDLFGSYCAFSGNGEPWKTISMIQEEPFDALPVDCYFTGAGSLNDWQQNYTKVGFDYFLEKDPRFVEGENSWRIDVDGSHEWKVWYTCLYNAMQVMFQTYR